MAKRRTDDYEDSEEYYELKRAVGRRIRTLRQDRGLSGKRLADLAQVSSVNFGVIESGYANVTLMSLERIARALEVPLVALLEDTPGVTTKGFEGMVVTLRSDLDQVGRQLDLCRDELAKLTARFEAFAQADEETRIQIGKAEKASRRPKDK